MVLNIGALEYRRRSVKCFPEELSTNNLDGYLTNRMSKKLYQTCGFILFSRTIIRERLR